MPPYDLKTLYESLFAAIAAGGPIGQRMGVVIDACERQRPHADWECMRRIDFDADLAVLPGWLHAAWREGVVRRGDQGLWFGIFNPIDGEDGPTSDMYVASGPVYAPYSLDWPGEIDLRDGVSYLDSAVLGDIYRIAYGPTYGLNEGLGNDAEYPLALAYGVIAATTALEQGRLPPDLAALRGAAAGFDDGDALFIGAFDNLRFCRQLRRA